MINPVRHQTPVGTYPAPNRIGPRAWVYWVSEQYKLLVKASINAVGLRGYSDAVRRRGKRRTARQSVHYRWQKVVGIEVGGIQQQQDDHPTGTVHSTAQAIADQIAKP